MKEFISNISNSIKPIPYPNIEPLNKIEQEQIPPNIGLDEEINFESNIDDTISQIMNEINMDDDSIKV
jgi:hypothetical protein